MCFSLAQIVIREPHASGQGMAGWPNGESTGVGKGRNDHGSGAVGEWMLGGHKRRARESHTHRRALCDAECNAHDPADPGADHSRHGGAAGADR
jgi:hypothetical protein